MALSATKIHIILLRAQKKDGFSLFVGTDFPRQGIQRITHRTGNDEAVVAMREGREEEQAALSTRAEAFA